MGVRLDGNVERVVDQCRIAGGRWVPLAPFGQSTMSEISSRLANIFTVVGWIAMFTSVMLPPPQTLSREEKFHSI
jgi:hypothetical protein